MNTLKREIKKFQQHRTRAESRTKKCDARAKM